MSEHIVLGTRGERIACDYLEQHGFRLLERNWRCHAGELDIVAVDGETLVVVEVKTRRSTDCGHPFEALTPTKVARLYRLAVLWCVDRQWKGPFRIDAIGVIIEGASGADVEQLQGVQ